MKGYPQIGYTFIFKMKTMKLLEGKTRKERQSMRMWDKRTDLKHPHVTRKSPENHRILELGGCELEKKDSWVSEIKQCTYDDRVGTRMCRSSFSPIDAASGPLNLSSGGNGSNVKEAGVLMERDRGTRELCFRLPLASIFHKVISIQLWVFFQVHCCLPKPKACYLPELC